MTPTPFIYGESSPNQIHIPAMRPILSMMNFARWKRQQVSDLYGSLGYGAVSDLFRDGTIAAVVLAGLVIVVLILWI